MVAIQTEKIAKHRLASSVLSTIISVTLVLFIVGLLGIVLINAKRIADNVRENIGFEVMLMPDVTEGQITYIQQTLEKKPYVKSVKYVSKEQATQETIDLLGHDFRDIVGDVIPPSFQLKINADYTTMDSLQKIEKELNLMENISDVCYQKSYINNVNDNINKIGIVLLVICGLLLIISFALINNTIRLYIYAKRFTIKSMLLVGAKRKTIYRPFITNSIVQGIIASVLAIALMLLVLYMAYSRPSLNAIVDFSQPIYYAILFGIMFLLGILLNWISTLFAVRKYIKMKIDKLYA